jgi:hypothetical protein
MNEYPRRFLKTARLAGGKNRDQQQEIEFSSSTAAAMTEFNNVVPVLDPSYPERMTRIENSSR